MYINFFRNENEDNDDDVGEEEINELQKEILKEDKFKSKMKTVEKRLEEYKKAFEYFGNNVMSRRQQETAKIVEQIELVQERLKKIEKSKRWEEVDISNIPKEITPEFIYGCTYEERDYEFKKVITYKKKKLKDVEKNLKNLEKNPTKRNILEKRKKLKEDLEKNIQIYEQHSKDIWCPPPIYKEKKGKDGSIRLEIPKIPIPFKIDKMSNNNNNLYSNCEINEKTLNFDISEEKLNNEILNEENEENKESEENKIKDNKDDNMSNDVNNQKNDNSKKSDCNILNDNENNKINNEQENDNSNKNKIEISNNK